MKVWDWVFWGTGAVSRAVELCERAGLCEGQLLGCWAVWLRGCGTVDCRAWGGGAVGEWTVGLDCVAGQCGYGASGSGFWYCWREGLCGGMG